MDLTFRYKSYCYFLTIASYFVRVFVCLFCFVFCFVVFVFIYIYLLNLRELGVIKKIDDHDYNHMWFLCCFFVSLSVYNFYEYSRSSLQVYTQANSTTYGRLYKHLFISPRNSVVSLFSNRSGPISFCIGEA